MIGVLYLVILLHNGCPPHSCCERVRNSNDHQYFFIANCSQVYSIYHLIIIPTRAYYIYIKDADRIDRKQVCLKSAKMCITLIWSPILKLWRQATRSRTTSIRLGCFLFPHTKLVKMSIQSSMSSTFRLLSYASNARFLVWYREHVWVVLV